MVSLKTINCNRQKSDEIMIVIVALFASAIGHNNRIIIFTENGQKFFWIGGFCHGSVGLQETTILFCIA